MEKIAVMYSGGVDSTLVADMAATDADEIYLLTCISNCHLKDETAEHAYERMRPRVKLLENRHPSKKFTHIILISKQFLDLTLCNSANGGKACIYGFFRHLLYGRTIRI